MQSTHCFGMTDTEFAAWLEKYITTTATADRMNVFRELHLHMLQEGIVTPIGVSPYYAIARKPWKFDAYQMFAGTPLWTLKHE